MVGKNFPLLQEKYFFLLPWLTANIVSALLEFLVFFHLLSKIKKVGREHCQWRDAMVPWCHGAMSYIFHLLSQNYQAIQSVMEY